MNDQNFGAGLVIQGSSSNGGRTVNRQGVSSQKNLKPVQTVKLLPPEGGMKIQFPSNYFRPEGTKSLDLRNLINVPNGTILQEFWKFTAPKSTAVKFTHYAVFTDILIGSQVEFLPQIDGRRTLQYHGDPNNNFKINLSVSVDMSAVALIPCEITLSPGQTLTWKFSNQSGADAPMGVRMVGYVDNASTRRSGLAGG